MFNTTNNYLKLNSSIFFGEILNMVYDNYRCLFTVCIYPLLNHTIRAYLFFHYLSFSHFFHFLSICNSEKLYDQILINSFNYQSTIDQNWLLNISDLNLFYWPNKSHILDSFKSLGKNILAFVLNTVTAISLL